MNFKELSEASGIKYETVRNYVKVLIEEGLIDEVNEDVIQIVKKMPDYTSKGFTVVEAAHRAVVLKDTHTSVTEELTELRDKIASLQEENQRLERELGEEKATVAELKERLESFESNTENSSAIDVYKEDVKTAADALKTAVKSAGSGLVQFLRWLFDTEEGVTKDHSGK
ncbi:MULTISPECIES: winged helix-turn-helix domain-containing protein [unclassified Mesotoga]|uniref:winged helix-turn-helix domain-containing protein n=1 Tax=unclassified Mesotoga TaxID=1184398 RepID=UPI000DA66233|nr:MULTISPECIES: winged helix-turn-helix domain-containing protein [unclassified Mesotoga]